MVSSVACESFEGATADGGGQDANGPTDASIIALDASKGDGGCAQPFDKSAARDWSWAFVSSVQFGGDIRYTPTGTGQELTGVRAADAYCTEVGVEQLGGVKYLAYLATEQRADGRFIGAGPWRTPDGVTIFASQAAMAGAPAASLAVLPSGCVIPDAEPSRVWTGSGQGGARAAVCPGWAPSVTPDGGTNGDAGAIEGTYGDARRLDTTWQGVGRSSCAGVARVYCFEVKAN